MKEYLIETPESPDYKGKQCFKTEVNGREIYVTWFYRNEHQFVPPIDHEHNYKLEFPRHIKTWSKFIKEGSVVIDIGAAMLDTTLPMAALTGPTGKVLAFEPGYKLQKTIKLHLENNPDLNNILFFDKAIMDSEGEYEFFYDPTETNGGFKRLTSHLPSIFPNKVTVKGIRLDTVLKQSNIAPQDISFIKLDTEGHDCQIIYSIIDIVRVGRPIIQVENFPFTWGEIVSVCQLLNYAPINPDTLQPSNATLTILC